MLGNIKVPILIPIIIWLLPV